MSASGLLLAPSHVLVIGGGLAGLVAALSAADKGVRVTLFEKSRAIPSGASICASSGLSAARDADDIVAFACDLTRCGGARVRAPLVSALAVGSLDARAWLERKGATPLTRAIITGGHSVPRTWLPPAVDDDNAPCVGALVSTAMAAAAARHPLITLRASSAVVALLPLEGGGVAGARLDGGEEVSANAVVLATGGFGAAPELLPTALASFPYSSAQSATGSGLRIAAAVGADLVDMDLVQLHPTAFTQALGKRNHLWLAPEGLRGAGGVLLDPSSYQRFYNELAQRDVLAAAILARQDRVALLVLPAAAAAIAPGANFHEKGGRLMRLVGAQGLASWLWEGGRGRVDSRSSAALAALLTAELKNIALIARGETRDTFGRNSFGQEGLWEGAALADLLVARVTPAIHYTLGGVAINSRGAVIDSKNNHVRNLYAAGEVTGGVHGSCRLAGAALCETVVFGRIAGESAAAAAMEEGDTLQV